MATNLTNERRRSASRRCVTAVLAALAGASAVAQDAAAGRDERVEMARATLSKWVETRQAIARTQSEWRQDRERLGDSIALVQREIETLRGKITEAETGAAEADKKKVELAQEAQRLEQYGAVYAQHIAGLEARALQLVQRLPDPLREKLAPVVQRIPASPELAAKADATKLAQRYLSVVGVLNEIDKWNREVTITSEVRQLAGGQSAEVTALYLGIGQGFYVTQKGDAAGIGTAGPEGWTWSPRNEVAPEIARAIAIARNEKVAGFVLLPVQINQVHR